MGKIYTQKPPVGSTIDWSHPLSKGLVGCWLMNEGGGSSVINLARYNQNVLQNTSWTVSGLKFNTATSGDINLDNLPKLLDYTAHFLIKPTTLSGGTNTWGLWADWQVNKLNYYVTIGSGQLTLNNGDGGANNDTALYAGSVITINKEWHVTFVRKYKTTYIYINGAVSSSRANTYFGGITTNEVNIGCRTRGGTDNTYAYDGYIKYSFIYNRALSPQEISSLYQAPYQFIKRRSSKGVKYTLFDAQKANIIAGLDSAQSEANGWDATVKTSIPASNVVRTSDTVVTITLPATATYDITAQETITATVPATALAGAEALVASPTFTIDPVSASTTHLLSLTGVGK